MTTQPTSRVPAGVPTGGQFASSAHAEAGVDLASNDRDALIADYLGPGDPLTDDQQRLLTALIDPEVNANSGYGTDIGTILEDLASNGDDDTYYGVGQIADRLHVHYQAETDQDGAGGFDFDLHRSGDYETASYAVGVHLGSRRGGGYLSETHDSKYLDPTRGGAPETSGLRKALRIAENLDGDFQRLRGRAQILGLLPKDAPATHFDATVRVGAAQEAVRRAQAESEKATLALAGYMVRDRWPDAQHLVLGDPEDADRGCFVHAVLDATGKPIAYPGDTFNDPRTRALQVVVADLPRGGPAHVPAEQWGDPDNKACFVDLDTVLPASISTTSGASR